MADREKVLKGLQAHADGCGYRSHHCDAMECPYRYGDESCDIEEMCRDALELLKEQPETIDELNTAIATKHSLKWFSPYEVGLAMVAYGQMDPQFKWGETIRYSPSEVEKILKGESLDETN